MPSPKHYVSGNTMFLTRDVFSGQTLRPALALWILRVCHGGDLVRELGT